MRLSALTIILLLAGCISSSAQTAAAFISSDKTFYSSSESIHYTITPSSVSCNGGTVMAYVDLLNEQLQLVHQQVIKLSDHETNFELSLAGISPGYYLLRAYTPQQARQPGGKIHSIAIGIDIPLAQQEDTRPLVAMFYPEGGKVLLNFTTRFTVFLQTPNGQPVTDKILVRNKAGQLIAAAKTSANGWAAIDIPLVQHDFCTIITGKGDTLRTIDTDNDPLVQKTGYSLHTSLSGEQAMVEMRKAEAEPTSAANLRVFYKNILLYESKALFRGDTTIVETGFLVKGFENKLLRLVLSDADHHPLAERLLLIPSVNNDEDMKLLKEEWQCRGVQRSMAGYDFLQLSTVNDYLVSMLPADTAATADGFSLFFMEPSLAGQTPDYSIMDEKGAIIQIGSATADNSGKLEISGCTFKGAASVKFYVNGKEAGNEIKNIPASPSGYDYTMARQELYALKQDPAPSKSHAGMTGNNPDDATANTPHKEMQGITVSATRKTRLSDLEDKYVRNGMFKDMSALSFNVEDDSTAARMSLTDYLLKKVPGLMMKQGNLVYKMGVLDYYVDEASYKDIPEMYMGEVGFIRFFKSPVSGGFSAQKGGALVRGGNGFVGGLQGTVAIYTKKAEPGKSTGPVRKGLPVKGYEN